MPDDIRAYHDKLTGTSKLVCDKLYEIIDGNLAATERKVWYAARAA